MDNSKTVNVSKRAVVEKLSKLKANKKYWVQVRVAKKVGREVYYSSWSAKKTVKTKR